MKFSEVVQKLQAMADTDESVDLHDPEVAELYDVIMMLSHDERASLLLHPLYCAFSSIREQYYRTRP
jgi:hypothetical protein